MLKTLSVAAVAVILSGCGTIISLSERYPRNKVYSGVNASWNGHVTFPDIPFSFVADTILLPYTIPKTIGNYSDSDDKWKPSMSVADDQLAGLRLGQSKMSVQELLGEPHYFGYYCKGNLDSFPALQYKLTSGPAVSVVFDRHNELVATFTLFEGRQRSYLIGKDPCLSE